MKRTLATVFSTLLAVSMAAKTKTEAKEEMVFRQDLSPEQLVRIDKENLDSPWNDEFKVPRSEFKHERALKPESLHILKASADYIEPEWLASKKDKDECKIALLGDSRTDLYMLLYGYIQGLYRSENYPTKCKRCDAVALPFSQMVHGLGNVLNLFTEVISENAFAEYGATERLTFLYDSYLVFWDFGINFDRILNDDTIII